MGGELTPLTGAVPWGSPNGWARLVSSLLAGQWAFACLPTSSCHTFLSKPGIVDQLIIFPFFVPSKDQINSILKEAFPGQNRCPTRCVALELTKKSYKQTQNLQTNVQIQGHSCFGVLVWWLLYLALECEGVRGWRRGDFLCLLTCFCRKVCPPSPANCVNLGMETRHMF